MTHSEQINELLAALSAAQAEIEHAAKDKTGQVGQQKTRYADLASVWEACRPALTKWKLSVTQWPKSEGNKVTVETMLGHSSGQWIREELTLHAVNASPQAVGSAITYARRYALAAAVGVAPDDDDGQAAQGNRDPKQPAKQQTNGQAQPTAAQPTAAQPPAVKPPVAKVGTASNPPMQLEQPVQAKPPLERLKDWATGLERQGLALASDATGWIALRLNAQSLEELASKPEDKLRQACKEFRLKANMGDVKHFPREREQAENLFTALGVGWQDAFVAQGWPEDVDPASLTRSQLGAVFEWLRAIEQQQGAEEEVEA